MDKNLNWDAHRAKLVKKLATSSGILSRIMDNIPDELHKDFYHTLCESHLTYGITVWGGAFESTLDPLFKAQESASVECFATKRHIVIVIVIDKF